MTKPACTMADVAHLAGVSAMTVSRALRFNTGVSSAVRARVAQAVQDLGYTLDQSAGSLSSGRSRLIGLIVPTFENPHFGMIADSLRAPMADQSVDLFIGSSEFNPLREEMIVETMLRRRVEAIAIAGVHRTARTADLLLKSHVPIVEFYDAVPSPLDHSVSIDPVAAAGAVVGYLLERGRRRIAVAVSALGVDPWGDARAHAIVAEAERVGASAVRLLRHADPKAPILQGVGAVDDIIARGLACDALVCLSDRAAMGAIERGRQCGVAVPETLAVMGFGDQEVARFMHPTITTVAFDAGQIGSEIARILRASIALEEAGCRPPCFTHSVAFAIVSRQSA